MGHADCSRPYHVICLWVLSAVLWWPWNESFFQTQLDLLTSKGSCQKTNAIVTKISESTFKTSHSISLCTIQPSIHIVLGLPSSRYWVSKLPFSWQHLASENFSGRSSWLQDSIQTIRYKDKVWIDGLPNLRGKCGFETRRNADQYLSMAIYTCILYISRLWIFWTTVAEVCVLITITFVCPYLLIPRVLFLLGINYKPHSLIRSLRVLSLLVLIINIPFLWGARYLLTYSSLPIADGTRQCDSTRPLIRYWIQKG